MLTLITVDHSAMLFGQHISPSRFSQTRELSIPTKSREGSLTKLPTTTLKLMANPVSDYQDIPTEACTYVYALHLLYSFQHSLIKKRKMLTFICLKK